MMMDLRWLRSLQMRLVSTPQLLPEHWLCFLWIFPIATLVLPLAVMPICLELSGLPGSRHSVRYFGRDNQLPCLRFRELPRARIVASRFRVANCFTICNSPNYTGQFDLPNEEPPLPKLIWFSWEDSCEKFFLRYFEQVTYLAEIMKNISRWDVTGEPVMCWWYEVDTKADEAFWNARDELIA